METKVFITNNKVVLPVKEETYKTRPDLYVGWRRASAEEIKKAGHILVPIQEIETKERKPKQKAEE